MKLTAFQSILFLLFLIPNSSFLHGNEIFCSKPDYQLQLPKTGFVTLGDVNNDGKNDLLAVFLANDKKYKTIIFYNKDGKLESTPNLELKGNFKSSMKLAIGDFDGDGKNDIAANEYKTLHLFLGVDNFQSDISNINMNSCSSSIYPTKLTPGGNCDFISSGVTRKWLGGDKWNSGYIHQPEDMKENFNKLCVPIDLNGDGQTDIIALPNGEDHIRLYYGPFITLDIKAMDAAKFQLLNFEKPAYLATGFLNGNKNLDIAVSSNEKTGIFYQARPIGFYEDIPPLIINCGGPLLIADFNGDKKDDLALLDSKKRKIFIFLQKDNKSFPEKSEEADCVIPIKKGSSFCSGDINGDGLTDLVVSDGVSYINVYLNELPRPKGRGI